jgi:tetratricopeptide (TPR) repeat protein
VKLGSFHVTRAWHFWSNNAAEDYRRGAELIQRALSEPNVPPKAQQIGHWNLAIVRAAENDFPRAEAEAQAAINLAPYDANMLLELASIPIMAGSLERALDWIAKAAARDPASQRIGYFLGWAYVTLGENEKVIASLKEDALFPDEFLLMAIAHVRLDHMDEARAAVQQALELNPQFTQAKWRRGILLQRSEHPRAPTGRSWQCRPAGEITGMNTSFSTPGVRHLPMKQAHA